jgi:hypothetical protein
VPIAQSLAESRIVLGEGPSLTQPPSFRLLGAVPTLWPFPLQLASGSVSYATSLGLALEVTLAKRNLSKRKHCALTFDSLMLVNG